MMPPQRHGSAFHASDDLGQRRGYRWFVIGMAPMSGFEQSPVAPLWSRAGRLLRARHAAAKLSRPASVQEQVRSRVGVTVSRVSGGLARCASRPTCPHWSRAVIAGSFTSSQTPSVEFGRQFRDTHHKFFEDGLAVRDHRFVPVAPADARTRMPPLREQSDRSFERVSSRGHAGGIVVLEPP